MIFYILKQFYLPCHEFISIIGKSNSFIDIDSLIINIKELLKTYYLIQILNHKDYEVAYLSNKIDSIDIIHNNLNFKRIVDLNFLGVNPNLKISIKTKIENLDTTHYNEVSYKFIDYYRNGMEKHCMPWFLVNKEIYNKVIGNSSKVLLF